MSKTKNKYILPVRKKDIKLIISDPKAHNDFLEHGIDFLVPIGTEILAARKGKVVDVKVDSNEGGFEEKYIGNKYLNFITIEHEKGEFSQYAHLKFNGACVKEGDKVKAGEVIGYSGNTGYTSTPHLHFHVYRDVDTEIGWETLQVEFEGEELKIIRTETDLTNKERKILKKYSAV